MRSSLLKPIPGKEIPHEKAESSLGSCIYRRGSTSVCWRGDRDRPTAALTGYDPDENNRLGFTYLLRDKKLGRQVWTAEEVLPVSYDPSLWGTAELVK